jgi:photosystem II stability/assembly factor-like uncharacterized protein
VKRRLLKYLIPVSFLTVLTVGALFLRSDEKSQTQWKPYERSITSKKTLEEKYTNAIEREKHEFNFQKNPVTGEIPLEEKAMELEIAQEARIRSKQLRSSLNTYITRGPTNLGGRTRALKVDLSDNTSNTILAGGVSSGLFRTTDGGASWTKVSANDEIHNVSCLAQDPRPGFQNIWYYGTGEWTGNSASLGSAYRGQGIWRSTDSGLSWTEITDPSNLNDFDEFDSYFDYVNNLFVHPVSGDLFAAVTGKLYRYDGTNFVVELEEPDGATGWTDVTIASDGTVYASFDISSTTMNGVWSSPSGNGNWTRIAQQFNPFQWRPGGNARTVLATAPSNPDILYALYNNGVSGTPPSLEADLWRYDASSSSWTEYSDVLPDEPGGDSPGNDPFAIQGGYDLVVSVNPQNENFVLVGGTNAYKIADITDAGEEFVRIGGYNSNQNYALYQRGGDEHHPDLHAYEFDPFDPTGSILFTGSDGGVHKTSDVYAAEVVWENLNNNYQTYQFYHIAMNPTPGSNGVLGGTQDNGTPVGGTDYSSIGTGVFGQIFPGANQTEMERAFGGDGVAVGYAPRDNNTHYQLYLGSQNGNAAYLDSRTGYTTITPSGSSSQFVTYFYLDPDNTNALYYAGLNTLYLTNDAENVTIGSWTNAGTLPTNEFLRTFATTPGTYNPATSNLFIGGSNGGLFRVPDPQNITDLSGAVNITPPTASTANGAVVSGIAIHPTNPDLMLVVYANYGIENIFWTDNATAATPTWTNVERNLDRHSIRSAAITEVNGEINYFVGTARGLYSSTNPLANDWTLEGPDDIGLAVVSGLVYRHADGKLLVGTHGNGMFETTVQSLSTNEFTLSENAVKLYPNPATATVTVLKGPEGKFASADYKIFNLTGALVQEGTSNLQGEIDVRPLATGSYILNIDDGTAPVSIRFMKN